MLKDIDVGAIFKTYSLGISTNRDAVVYGWNQDVLSERLMPSISAYNLEVERWRVSGKPKNVDEFVNYEQVKWSEHLKNALRREQKCDFDKSKLRRSLYRPYIKTWLYYDTTLIDRPGLTGEIFPTQLTETENLAICFSVIGPRAPFTVICTNHIPDLHLNSTDGFQCFPLYTYTVNGAIRHDNITDWALAQFKETYGDPVTKRDIFHYVYGLLHSPAYRTRYAENLKRDLPRIPLAATRADYEAFKEAGERLATLHLTYESAPEYPLTARQTPGEAISWRVTKMRLSPDKTELVVNPTLTLSGIPPEAFSYKLGNRSALEWVVDQYQVKTDARSGLTSDPNRVDDPEYIVRLARRVVTVSLETMKIVAALPKATPA